MNDRAKYSTATVIQIIQLRRWVPKFSLRCLLLVTVLAAIVSAYVGLPFITYQRENSILSRLEKLGATCSRRVFDSNASQIQDAASYWGQERFFRRVDHVDLSNLTITDQDIEILSQLEELRSVNLANTAITGQDVDLSQLEQLRSLNLANAAFTGQDINLSQLEELREVNLANTAITDQDIDLSQSRKLTSVNLANTAITDKTVEILSEFPNIRTLNLSGTQITDASGASCKRLNKLQHLDVSSTAVTGKFFAQPSQVDPL